MTNYQLIMKLLLQGRSYRQSQHLCGAASATISKARKAMDSHGITSVEDLARVIDATIGELIRDGRLVVSEDFADIDFEAVIEARRGRDKTPLRGLWSNYLGQPTAADLKLYSYERFRQLVSAHVATAGMTALISHRPGHTMQID